MTLTTSRGAARHRLASPQAWLPVEAAGVLLPGVSLSCCWSSVPHEHVGVEQTYVLEGRLVDSEGEVKAGEYVWRPAGSRHIASAPEGALLLGMFLQPNRFL